MDVEMREKVVSKLNNHIGMFWLLATVLKVPGTFAQADYCAGGTSVMDDCLKEVGSLSQNATEMPVNLEELTTMCKDFSKGMKCLNDFVDACLQDSMRESVQLQFESHMYIMRQLCENDNFRREYFKYPECNKVMRIEWERCGKPITTLVLKQQVYGKDHSEEKIIKICCAKFCFLDCFNRVSRPECEPEATKMHHDLAAGLSCTAGNSSTSQVNSTVCKDICGRSTRNASSVVQVIFLFLVCLVSYSWRK